MSNQIRDRVVYSLADLESFDPSAPLRGLQRRYLCPDPTCSDHQRPSRDRSLVVNTETGAWICHRCGERGRLTEFFSHRQHVTTPRGRLLPRARGFDLQAPRVPLDQTQSGSWRKRLARSVPIAGTPGADYLAQRGISVELIATSGVRYAVAWQHYEKHDDGWRLLGTDRRVVFPIHDQASQVVAISARAIDPDFVGPKFDTRGPKSLGVFATPGALQADPLVICEAPIDSLSLASVGLPSVALCGTSGPDWLLRFAAFRRVALALDADPAGDEASETLATALRSVSSRVERWRPSLARDWNDALTLHGAAALARAIAV